MAGGNNPQAKTLECLLCAVRYSEEDILQGEYQLDTLVCSSCYRKMQLQPRAKSCFGKPEELHVLAQVKLHGYNPNAPECSRLCPDRLPCRRLNQYNIGDQ